MCSFLDINYLFFFFNDTATTEIYTLSLHDALPIFAGSFRIAIHQTIGLPWIGAAKQGEACGNSGRRRDRGHPAMRSGLYAPRPAEFTPMKIAAYLIEKIGSTVSGYFHPSLWLSESHGLLVVQRHDGIHMRGATGGNPASRKGHGHQQCSNSGYRSRIMRAHSKQQSSNQRRQRQCAGYTKRHADARNRESKTEHQRPYISLFGTERHANPEFARAQAHGVRHHTINPNGRKKRSDGRKNRHQHSAKMLACNRVSERLVHRGNVGERQIGIHSMNDVADWRYFCKRIALRTHRKHHARKRKLGMRPVAHGHRSRVQPLPFYVANDADDL